MPFGGGEYEAEALEVLKKTGATMVAVLVVQGNRGTAFSLMTARPEIIRDLPGFLKAVAESIRDEVDGAVLKVQDQLEQKQKQGRNGGDGKE